MQKIIHIFALLASLIVLAAALWQDWGIWLTLERVLISYLGFFFLGAFMALAIRVIPFLEGKPKPPVQVQVDGMESATEVKSHITRKVGK